MSAVRRLKRTSAPATARHEIENLKVELAVERNRRISAQRGTVAYVRAVEALDQWLLNRPALLPALRPVLQELGLWGVELGYDPDQDPLVQQEIAKGEVPPL